MWQLQRGILTQVAAMAPAAAAPSDYPNSILMLGFEGSNGSTSLTDESFVARGAATAVGNAQISTAQFKFGAASGLFDGSGDRFTFPNASNLRLSTANSDQFTIGMWIRPHAAGGTLMCLDDSSGSNCAWVCNFTPAKQLQFQWSKNGSWFAGNLKSLGATGTVLTLDTQAYVEYSKNSSGKLRISLDGVLQASSTPADSIFFASTAALRIGGSDVAGDFNGYMDELAIFSGVCLHDTDSNFAPPTAAWPRS